MPRWPRMPFFVFRGFSSAPSMLAFFRLNARRPPPIHKHFAVVVSDIVVWKSWSCLLCHYLRVILQTTKISEFYFHLSYLYMCRIRVCFLSHWNKLIWFNYYCCLFQLLMNAFCCENFPLFYLNSCGYFTSINMHHHST